MTTSLLLALPAELRIRIYELALTYPQTIIVHESNIRHELHPSTSASLLQAQALTRTCKQIYKECGATFYTRNDFTLKLSAFLANVVLLRHFAPRFDKSKDNRSSSLDIILPSPLKQFDIHSIPNNVAANQSRALLYRLSNNLYKFQNQHLTISVSLHLPIQLNDLADESRLDIEVDFTHAEGSIDKAIAKLQEMLNNNGRLQYLVLYINELLEWKQQGFSRDYGK